jgi:hypothetical protein
MIPGIVIACAVCFANADSPLLDAARVGVLMMAAVTSCVLVAFARWFRQLARLSSQNDRWGQAVNRESGDRSGRES